MKHGSTQPNPFGKIICIWAAVGNLVVGGWVEGCACGCCNATDVFYLCCWFLFLLWRAAINSTNACTMRDIAMCAFFVCLIRGSIRSVCKTGQVGSQLWHTGTTLRSSNTLNRCCLFTLKYGVHWCTLAIFRPSMPGPVSFSPVMQFAS